mmetsp:Transcript_2031/g.7282  ORF Transcript_2031/g.7282 Transcript_2031/m.7282 type:complete len:608 (-) Transcript_2031:94-1917(-)
MSHHHHHTVVCSPPPHHHPNLTNHHRTTTTSTTPHQNHQHQHSENAQYSDGDDEVDLVNVMDEGDESDDLLSQKAAFMQRQKGNHAYHNGTPATTAARQSGTPSAPTMATSTTSTSATNKLTPTQLSRRLYSEQLLRYQSESLLSSQKQMIKELKERSEGGVRKMREMMERAQEREKQLLQEREQYRARFIAQWCERRDWRQMHRVFLQWREMVWRERERRLMEKTNEMRSFWVWRGMSGMSSKNQSRSSERHVRAVQSFVNERHDGRMRRLAFASWLQCVTESRKERMQSSKLQVVRSATASLRRDARLPGERSFDAKRMRPHIPALQLGTKSQGDEEKFLSDDQEEFVTQYLDGSHDRGADFSDRVLTENDVHTVTIDLQEAEAGKSYISSQNLASSFEYISPRRAPPTSNSIVEHIPLTEVSTPESTPKSPRRARLSVKQQSLVDRLSQPRRLTERVHSLDAGQWKSMSMDATTRHQEHSPSSGYSTLSARRSSSRKKSRSNSTKKSRAGSAKKRRTNSEKSSPLHSPRRYESVLRVNASSTSYCNGNTTQVAVRPSPGRLFEHDASADSFNMSSSDYVSPTKKPRLTAADKRRIREILESEGA